MIGILLGLSLWINGGLAIFYGEKTIFANLFLFQNVAMMVLSLLLGTMLILMIAADEKYALTVWQRITGKKKSRLWKAWFYVSRLADWTLVIALIAKGWYLSAVIVITNQCIAGLVRAIYIGAREKAKEASSAQ